MILKNVRMATDTGGLRRRMNISDLTILSVTRNALLDLDRYCVANSEPTHSLLVEEFRGILRYRGCKPSASFRPFG